MFASVKKDSMLMSSSIGIVHSVSSTRISWMSLHASAGRLRRRGTIVIRSFTLFTVSNGFSWLGSFTSCSSSTVHAANTSDWLNWCFRTS